MFEGINRCSIYWFSSGSVWACWVGLGSLSPPCSLSVVFCDSSSESLASGVWRWERESSPCHVIWPNKQRCHVSAHNSTVRGTGVEYRNSAVCWLSVSVNHVLYKGPVRTGPETREMGGLGHTGLGWNVLYGFWSESFHHSSPLSVSQWTICWTEAPVWVCKMCVLPAGGDGLVGNSPYSKTSIGGALNSWSGRYLFQLLSFMFELLTIGVLSRPGFKLH